ncbi:MAG: hypothetical protein GIW99_07375 [Candidatus Eremiobacteraeota bacterium]|nr:hypothetical protein [Candidatus Eremiobacteraeota bacterium]MBC5827484.1 hypothetical protein [Candidatus Eremiobacteraeota bacterium]
MSKLRRWIVTLGQLALAAAWLMSGIVYIATPQRMALLLGMSDAVRLSLGLAMTALALVVAAGTILWRRPIIARLGVAALAAAGVMWTAYDVQRHWTMFAYFHALLTALAIGIWALRANESSRVTPG